MDATTFSQEVRARERMLYRIAVGMLANDADAADAVQDALLAAWEKRHTLRQPQYFGTWLTRILINRCKQMLRQRRPQEELKEDAVVQHAGVGNLALKMALEQLEVKDRVPLLLYHLEGYPVKDIARILRLPQGTVTSRLARGRKKLRALLEDEEVLAHA